MSSTQGLEDRLLQARLECRGGAELLVAELRVHVHVAPERNELGTQGVGQGAGERCSQGTSASYSRDINWFTL